MECLKLSPIANLSCMEKAGGNDGCEDDTTLRQRIIQGKEMIWVSLRYSLYGLLGDCGAQSQKYSSLFDRSIMLSEVDLWAYLLVANVVVNVSKSFLSVVPSLYSKVVCVSYNVLRNSVLRPPLRKYLRSV